ncbi:MAG: MotA/TolQ/ExbB proton channel family protein [Chthoniobacteraceae bacterium]
MKRRPHLLLALAALLISATAFAEEAPPADEKAPAVHSKSLWQQIREGGWVMVPIGACSVLTLFLIGDGIIRVTSPKKVLPPDQVEAVRNLFRAGKYPDTFAYCRAHPSPFTNVCGVAVSLLGEGKSAVEEGMVAEAAKENSRMQTYISYLSVIGVCAPMIGLLGTVTGMIKAFATLGTSGIGDPSSLSAAIGEVLVATASGLFIAIPAFGAYYYLRARAAKALHDIQDTMASLLRKMPYDKLAGVHIGDEELYAADPEWWRAEGEAKPSQA